MPLTRPTFNKIMENMVDTMTKGIRKLLTDNGVSGLIAISIPHGIWSTLVMDRVLGSSLENVTSDMEIYTIAAVLKKRNLSHDAPAVAAAIREIYKRRSSLDIMEEVRYVASDTTG